MEPGGARPLDCGPGAGLSTVTRRPSSRPDGEKADAADDYGLVAVPRPSARRSAFRVPPPLSVVERYREHPPCPALAPYVRCYWTLRGAPEAPGTRRVVPDACQDLLFRFRGPGDGRSAVVVGTMTEPLAVPDDGEADYLGVRFHPWGARPFLGVPARALTDLSVPLDDLWGPASREVTERLDALPPGRRRIGTLERALAGRLGESDEAPDAAVRAAVMRLEASRRGVAVAELARRVGLGRRQLGRRFRDAVGLPPSVAARVVRFQAALARIHAGPALSLSRVALEAGYYDQAHLTREFHALAGEPPGAYRLRRGLGEEPGP